MNKQELIDKAIDELGGALPEGGWGNHLIKPSDINPFYTDYRTHEGRHVNDRWQYICTIEEFNARKQERKMEGFKPKVGELCEVRWGMKTHWEKCVLIIGGNSLLINDEGERSIDSLDDIEFRPIKSECEIVIDKLKGDVYLHVINESDLISMRQSTGEDLAARVLGYLYDAGMLTLPK